MSSLPEHHVPAASHASRRPTHEDAAAGDVGVADPPVPPALRAGDQDAMPVLVLPAWGIDRETYERLCRHLGFTPSSTLYAKVAHYLLQVASGAPAPQGFAAWIADSAPGPLALRFVDLGTRLLMPRHPWRYRLNAIVAAHECDPVGYREMLPAQGSAGRAWLGVLATGVAVAATALPGVLWWGGRYCAYRLRGGGQRRERDYFGGKTVLVTGASRGLGLALVGRLLGLGARVVAVARSADALTALHEQAAVAGCGERLTVVAADLASPAPTSTILEHAGLDGARIDVVVANAGIKGEATGAVAPDVLRRTFAVNLFAAADAAATLAPAWRTRGDGHFVFVSSMGRWHGMVGTGAYNASKAALSVLAESLAMDLRQGGSSGVRVTVAEPGLIRTGMIAPRGLQRLLSVSAATAARRILASAARGDAVCRFPWSFACLTAAVALLPMRLRVKILARAKAVR